MKLRMCLGLLVAVAVSSALVPQDGFQRERGGKSDELKNSMEGKPPPKLAMAKWLNTGGKELSWAALNGKVVVLDFWAYW